jgi:hypothetical protein
MAAKKRKKKTKKWIQKAVPHLKKGALHRQLGIPEGDTIPMSLLLKNKHAGGKLGKRVRFVLNIMRK